MICSQCNKEFTKTHHRQKYCSKECSKKKYQSTNYLYRLKFLKSEKGKIYREKQNKYQQTDSGKNKGRVNFGKYRKTPKGIAAEKKVYEKRQSKGLINKYAKKYEKERRKSDPIFKLKGDIRHRLRIFLNLHNMKKTNSTFKMVGCTPALLKEYLEKRFKPGMTWKNHARDGWHIDHIIPLASAKTPEAMEKLMHYSNLQPLWAIENIKKGNKII